MLRKLFRKMSTETVLKQVEKNPSIDNMSIIFTRGQKSYLGIGLAYYFTSVYNNTQIALISYRQRVSDDSPYRQEEEIRVMRDAAHDSINLFKIILWPVSIGYDLIPHIVQKINKK
jgi:hypothetical protein